MPENEHILGYEKKLKEFSKKLKEFFKKLKEFFFNHLKRFVKS